MHHFEELLPLADRVLVIDPQALCLAEMSPDAAAVEARLEVASERRVIISEPTGASETRWRLPATGRSPAQWFARYIVGYVWLLCASPVMLLYMASGACIIGFVTVWFGFNYYSLGGLLRSVLHDETLVDLPAGRSWRDREPGFDVVRSEAASGERSASGRYTASRRPWAAAAVLPVLQRQMPPEGLAEALRRDAVRRSDSAASPVSVHGLQSH